MITVGLGLNHPSSNWAPTDLGSSLAAWWSADRRDLITLNGSNVSSWKDSVAGYDAVQATTANQPLYSPTGYNGAPGVTFDGVNDVLSTTGVGSLPIGANPCEMWAVFDQTALPADTGGRNIFSYGGGSAAQARALRRIVSSNINRLNLTVGDGATSPSAGAGPAVDLSGRTLVRGVVDGTNLYGSGNGLPLSTPVACIPATISTRIVLGASPTAASAFFQGTIRDIIVINGVLTVAQVAKLTDYLMAKRN